MADKLSKFNIKGTLADVIDAEARASIAELTESVAGMASDVSSAVSKADDAKTTAEDAQSAAEAAQRTANDALNGLAAKQNAITYSGNYIGNIDDIRDISIAFCAASSVSGTLPYSTGYFLLETFKADNGNTYIQKAYKYGGSDGVPNISYRIYANGQWYPWKSVALS